MFRFWTNDSRGSELCTEPSSGLASPLSAVSAEGIASPPNAHQPLKRRRDSDDGCHEPLTPVSSVKRPRLGSESESCMSQARDVTPPTVFTSTDRTERARDEIRHQFGLEILIKHNELRLVNQELAKCQAALEQLRRCHLIPYPVNCPTPSQMLEVSRGTGHAVQTHPGEPVPRWAPPFGITNGPYARHYAKWLIPDPAFDGHQSEWSSSGAAHIRALHTEGRHTRNTHGEQTCSVKVRNGRNSNAPKLQSLSNGYPQPKDKAGPCVLKRGDGQTVKLVCVDCHRDNFSSTQGFINHCRIAHKRDYKSHEEAAVHSGQIIPAAEQSHPVPEEKSLVTPSGTTTQVHNLSSDVHTFARADMSEREAYSALRMRLAEACRLYRQGVPDASYDCARSSDVTKRHPSQNSGGDKAALHVTDAPYLSRLMQKKNFNGNLKDLVADAKTKVSIEDVPSGEDSNMMDVPTIPPSDRQTTQMARVPVAAQASAGNSEKSSESKAPAQLNQLSPLLTATWKSCAVSNGQHAKVDTSALVAEEDVNLNGTDHSPVAFSSTHAPSLVSDDGDYDDSDEGSESETGESLGRESLSGLAELDFEDEHQTRSIEQGTQCMPPSKPASKHVTFVASGEKGERRAKPRGG